jgi:hypothetical protein
MEFGQCRIFPVKNLEATCHEFAKKAIRSLEPNENLRLDRYSATASLPSA